MKYAILLLTFIIGSLSASAQHLVQIGKGYSSTSVNTTVFRNSSLVTFKQNQYTAYYDADGYMVIGKRKLGSEHWELQRSQYKGNVTDAHNVISLMVDGEGYLHVAFDHHGQPLNYCRSTAPESLVLGEKEPMTGKDEADVTYPEFYRLSTGDLLFVYRSGASGRGNLVLNRYNLKQRKWQRVQDVLIDGEGQRNAYWQLYVDAKDVIHLSWVWRETWMVETNHDLCYACSSDGLINQTSMSADTEGHPYIVTYWRDTDNTIPQYRLVWHDGINWHNRPIMNRTQAFSLKGGGTKMIPISRPRIAVDKGRAFFLFRDAERGSKVSMAYTADLKSGEWQVTDLTDFSVDAWEPSLDTELWKQNRQLHVFVQETHQGDGEKQIASEPTPVYVLEINTKQ